MPIAAESATVASEIQRLAPRARHSTRPAYRRPATPPARESGEGAADSRTPSGLTPRSTAAPSATPSPPAAPHTGPAARRAPPRDGSHVAASTLERPMNVATNRLAGS